MQLSNGHERIHKNRGVMRHFKESFIDKNRGNISSDGPKIHILITYNFEYQIYSMLYELKCHFRRDKVCNEVRKTILAGKFNVDFNRQGS